MTRATCRECGALMPWPDKPQVCPNAACSSGGLRPQWEPFGKPDFWRPRSHNRVYHRAVVPAGDASVRAGMFDRILIAKLQDLARSPRSRAACYREADREIAAFFDGRKSAPVAVPPSMPPGAPFAATHSRNDELCFACGWRRGSHRAKDGACPTKLARGSDWAQLHEFLTTVRFALSARYESAADEQARIPWAEGCGPAAETSKPPPTCRARSVVVRR